MKHGSKHRLKQMIVACISILLLPTIIELFFKNKSQQYEVISEFFRLTYYIQMIVIAIAGFAGTGFLIIDLKEKRALRKMLIAENTDAIWNVESIKFYVRSVFYKVQSALEIKSVLPLQDMATTDFINWFKNELKYDNLFSSNASIEKTHIISCKDYADDSKDKFVAYIKVSLQFDKQETKDFSEIYHFIRDGNGWLLQKITSSNVFQIVRC